MISSTSSVTTEFDVIIIGAGISGINAAYRLQTVLPDFSYTIIETRAAIGGTWDLFRFPGIRSDSDLYTFGFPWRPWRSESAIADGASIRNYIRESAAAFGIDSKIQFHHKLVSASWSSDQQVWALLVDADGEKKHYQGHFVIFCTGYYNYDEASNCHIPGLKTFEGAVVHPQFWPEDINYTDKRIVVIGSGATAVTLVPALAETASKVTMLQRSPSYILSAPSRDSTASSWISKFLPSIVIDFIVRLKFLTLPLLFYRFCRRYPNAARKLLRKETIKQLPSNIAHDPHFEPKYNPWEQRLCFDPDAKFFKALRSGKADVATGSIKTITATGVLMESGQSIPADIIITATGIKIQVIGGVPLTVDGQRINPTDKFLWNSMMFQDVPNAATIIGYVNASWTLGSDTTSQHLCRLLKYMKSNHFTSSTPRIKDPASMKVVPLLDLKSNYVERAKGVLPKAGNVGPWKPRSTYFHDLWQAKFGNVTTGLEFSRVSV